MRRAYHRILGMPQIRPEGLCFRATLKSGRATANPITWPFRSAKQTRSGTTIGLSCFAKWSISALVSGTNPQFRSHAWLYSALTNSTSSLKRFKLSGRRDRKSTRLNSSHASISYAVLCLKKKRVDRRVGDRLQDRRSDRHVLERHLHHLRESRGSADRNSTRLNSIHASPWYAGLR